MKQLDVFYDMIRDDDDLWVSQIKTYLLTPPLKKLLKQIQNSDMDLYGYEELIISTLKTGKYNETDRGWLQVIRTKWIRYIKTNKIKV